MRSATAACHPERSEAESKDPAKLSIDLSAVERLGSAREAASLLQNSALSALAFLLYSRVECRRCPITDIDRVLAGTLVRAESAARTRLLGRNQIATNHRRSPLGAVVLQLPGRAQNRRVDQNDQ